MFPRSAVAGVALLSVLQSGCPLVFGGLAAAQPHYDRGDFARRFVGSANAIAEQGCVEVAPSLRTWQRGVLLEWRMGNRCDQAAETDLSKLVVHGSTANGARMSIPLYDPVDEIRPLPLPPRREAYEAVVLMADDDVREICLDVSRALPPGDRPTASLCFETSVDGWQVARQGGT